jgi:hypothetical protein
MKAGQAVIATCANLVTVKSSGESYIGAENYKIDIYMWESW